MPSSNTTGSVKIKPATIQDLEFVTRCAEQAYQPYIERIGRKPAPMIADFTKQIGAGEVYVLLEDEIPRGYIVFYPRQNHLHIENVAVTTESQGKGYGRKMISFAEDAARKLGFYSIQLYTNEKMTENLGLYPALGYDEIGRRSEDGFNRVYFRKILESG